MDYEATGRKLGTGVKVLGRMAKQRLDAAGSPAPAVGAAGSSAAGARSVAATAPVTATAAGPVSAAPPAQPSRTKANVREGGRRFGKAVAGPLVKAGHVLWLEITGCFFALFSAGFVVEAWKMRAQWRGGPEHGHFLTYAALVVAFAYFCVTSFVRARRRGRG